MSASIKSGIEPAGDNNTVTLKDGDVYAKVSASSGTPTAEILKGTKDDLDGADYLRGETLDLTKIAIAGVEYNVTKIGAQSLKKAHMKVLR